MRRDETIVIKQASALSPTQTLSSSEPPACDGDSLLIFFFFPTVQSGATINPGIIEMQMPSVTAPQFGGGQVAHFIMLLSCCPLLLWREGPLEGCSAAMYNSCSNSYMSRGSDAGSETEVDFVVSPAHCACTAACTNEYAQSQEEEQGLCSELKRNIWHLLWSTQITVIFIFNIIVVLRHNLVWTYWTFNLSVHVMWLKNKACATGGVYFKNTLTRTL